jgi:hypothetical protein
MTFDVLDSASSGPLSTSPTTISYTFDLVANILTMSVNTYKPNVNYFKYMYIIEFKYSTTISYYKSMVVEISCIPRSAYTAIDIGYKKKAGSIPFLSQSI